MSRKYRQSKNNNETNKSCRYLFKYLLEDFDNDKKNDEDHEGYYCLGSRGSIIHEIQIQATLTTVVVSTNFCPTFAYLPAIWWTVIWVSFTFWEVQSFNIECKKHRQKDSNSLHHVTFLFSDLLWCKIEYRQGFYSFTISSNFYYQVI